MPGKREINDIRNDLFKDYKRLIDELQPKIFIMENVTGMAKGKMKGRFLEILSELKSSNYNVKCKQMNSKYYGVPQSRERLIFIGIRKDLKKEPVFPVPLNRIITVKETFKNVKNKTFAPKIENEEKIYKYLKQGQQAIDSVPVEILKKFIPRMVKKGTKYSFGNAVRRLSMKSVSHTITKTFAPFAAVPVHPLENRLVTIEEIKRLCSFPDNFILIGDYKKQLARLGNAVMPKFMQAIAETLKNEILIPYYEKKHE